MAVSKNRGTPKMDGLQWKTLLKWMIWGYHYFRKHLQYMSPNMSCNVPKMEGFLNSASRLFWDILGVGFSPRYPLHMDGIPKGSMYGLPAFGGVFMVGKCM